MFGGLLIPGSILVSVGIILAIIAVVLYKRGLRLQQHKATVTRPTPGISTLGYSQSGTQSAIVHPPVMGATIVYGPGAGDGYQGPPGHQGQPQAYQPQSRQYQQVPPLQYQQPGAPYLPQAPYPPQPDSRASEPSAPPPAYDDAIKL